MFQQGSSSQFSTAAEKKPAIPGEVSLSKACTTARSNSRDSGVGHIVPSARNLPQGPQPQCDALYFLPTPGTGSRNEYFPAFARVFLRFLFPVVSNQWFEETAHHNWAGTHQASRLLNAVALTRSGWLFQNLSHNCATTKFVMLRTAESGCSGIIGIGPVLYPAAQQGPIAGSVARPELKFLLHKRPEQARPSVFPGRAPATLLRAAAHWKTPYTIKETEAGSLADTTE